jgi:hypothetical protein
LSEYFSGSNILGVKATTIVSETDPIMVLSNGSVGTSSMWTAGLRITPLVVLCLIALTVASAQTQQSTRTIHVFVALADNEHQGIVPVPAHLGNGLDAERNLYWGAAAGVKTFFVRSREWSVVQCGRNATSQDVLERCVFVHRESGVYLVADAYRGDAIQQAILGFLDAAAGGTSEDVKLLRSAKETLAVRGGASLVAYVGHDGLMDFRLPVTPRRKDDRRRDAIILACASKQYFAEALRSSGAHPLLWTTNLMAPEAYTLKSAIDGWITGESGEQIRRRAATACDKYQHCGLRGAMRLFATGW